MPEERGRALLIGTPNDAWAILEQIAAGKFDPDEYQGGLQFTGWVCELMRIPHSASASISMPVMRHLLDYQSKINRSYKDLKYGERSTHRIKETEKVELELNIVVKANGSIYDADVVKPLTAFAKAVASKMESKHLAITFIGIALVVAAGYFGEEGFKVYVENQKAIHGDKIHADELIALSEQETARAKILGSIVSDTEEARKAQAQIEAGYQALLKGAVASGGANILGKDVPEDVAKEITSGPRHVGQGTRLDGSYEVIDIKRLGNGIYVVQLAGAGLDKPITADARTMFLPDDQIDLLLASLKNGKHLPFLLNAWRRSGKVVDAEIIRVSPPP